jgi:uncharacterized protein YndB with AHSA1/START domain
MAAPRHVFRIHIRATPEEVWQAITDPTFTRQYFHRTAFESTLEPGSGMRYVLPDGADAVVGEIEEVEPPRRLVMTWRALHDPAMADEPPSGASTTAGRASPALRPSIATSPSARPRRPAWAKGGPGSSTR